MVVFNLLDDYHNIWLKLCNKAQLSFEYLDNTNKNYSNAQALVYVFLNYA